MQEELQRSKYRYCIHKDEFVVGIGRPWAQDSGRKRTNNAYPRVISNLGQLSVTNEGKAALQMIKFMYHYARNLREKNDIIDWFRSPAEPHGAFIDGNQRGKDFKAFDKELKEMTPKWLPLMTDQIPVGFANTLGWAHPNTGDTMVTVMIGGLRTVMNGDFEVFPGDLIMWYWPFEKDCFKPNGERKTYINSWTYDEPTRTRLPPNVAPEVDLEKDSKSTVDLDERASMRETYFSRGFGNASEKKTKLVARVKPYIRDDDNPRMYDAYRVFGIAIAAARPHEMLDIKISRQSV